MFQQDFLSKRLSFCGTGGIGFERTSQYGDPAWSGGVMTTRLDSKEDQPVMTKPGSAREMDESIL